jgi:hypothetical protein
LRDGHEHAGDFAGFRLGIIVRAEDSHETYVAIRITASVHKNLTATIPNRAHGCDPGAWFPEYAPLPSSWAPDNGYGAHGSPAVPVWLFAPCSSHGLGGVAAGTAGA